MLARGGDSPLGLCEIYIFLVFLEFFIYSFFQ
ncbi:hypothetical protein HMF8227_01921 [Saliniradius amylolyticus]|uniref:Uncharacterized protein n=1 Tax=Saliniradius amylolyticus TaxID=2183582 RepID=A0A2S2E418_9ALTE|nr:hypothetical protein HMF8227_01921 [Saliniradius amylolyticus]